MSSSSDNDSDDRSTNQRSSVLQRELYNDAEMQMERDYMKDVGKSKRKIYKKLDALRIKLNQLKRRSCLNYRKELRKLELIQNEKLRLLKLNRQREIAEIEKEFKEDQCKMKIMDDAEWDKYISEQMKNVKEQEIV